MRARLFLPLAAWLSAASLGATVLVATKMDEAVAASPAPAAAGENPSFNLVNRAGMPIRELYFTPAGDANWGRNRLEGKIIAAGASYAARRRVDGNCIFDVRVVFADGHKEDRRGLNTCEADDVAFGAAPGPAGRKAPNDASFKLINRGKAPIDEAFATPSGTGNWGQNRLSDPLPAAADRIIKIPEQGTCDFDLRVVFEGGRKLERHHANLCKITDLPVP